MLNYFGRGGVRAESDLTEDWIWPEPPKEEQDVAPSTDEDKTEGATMANNVIKRKWNMNSMVQIEDLTGMTFQDEAAGHTFEISAIDDAGNAVALSGTPAGVFLRPDNTDQALTCSVSNGKVYATLPAGCYDIPGRFGLTIFLTSNSQTAAIYAAVGTVARTSSGTASPGTTQDVVDLINAINAAIAQIPASDTNLKAAMAPTYSTSALYAVGDYAWYNGVLYKCITAITSGETWTSSHWTAANMGGDVSALKSAITNAVEVLDNSVFAGENFKRGFFLEHTGELTPDKNYCVSDFVSVTAGGTIHIIAGDIPQELHQTYIVEYNSSKQRVEYWGVPRDDTGRDLTVTANTVYVRMGFVYGYDASITSGSTTLWEPETNGLDKQISDIDSDIENIQLILEKTISLPEQLSLNGIYLDSKKATWQNGIFNTTTGAVSGDYPYQYSYFKLIGAGSYIISGKRSTFGTNLARIALCDFEKTYIKYINGSGNGDFISFSISEEDMLIYSYIVILRKDDGDFFPRVYYNAVPFVEDGYYLPPKFGFDSNPLYKKKIICDGDSICAATPDNPKTGWSGWFGRFKMGYQMTGNNYGVGGGTITSGLYYSDQSARHWISTNIDTVYSNNPSLDYLILEGGTNDADVLGQFVGETPPQGFGTWSESDFSGNYDHTTFCGAVEYLFYKALSYYPKAKIGFIIAMEMGRNDASINNRRRYFDEIKKIAKKWHIPVLDLWENSGADARLTAFYDPTKTSQQNADAGYFYLDGQHPTSWGYDKMQPMIESWIMSI